jgi:hypothetical protein
MRLHEKHKGHEKMHTEMILILFATLVISQVALVKWREIYPGTYHVSIFVAIFDNLLTKFCVLPSLATFWLFGALFGSLCGHEKMHTEMILILFATLVISQVALVKWREIYPSTYHVSIFVAIFDNYVVDKIWYFGCLGARLGVFCGHEKVYTEMILILFATLVISQVALVKWREIYPGTYHVSIFVAIFDNLLTKSGIFGVFCHLGYILAVWGTFWFFLWP